MGLFKKIKEALFDDEEDFTDQIKITPEMRNEETPSKSEVKVEMVEKPKIKEVKVEKTPSLSSERETFSNQNNFPFLDFDEEEFEKQNTPAAPVNETVTVTNVKSPLPNYEYETKKRVERRVENNNYEKIEVTETTERKKFKPSLIISPVYGIMNEDRESKEYLFPEHPEKVDIKTIRDKAFGDKSTPSIIKETNSPVFYEETETVTIKRVEEQKAKVKTIDELLEDTSDVDVSFDTSAPVELDSMVLPSDQEKEDTKEIKVSKDDTTELEHDIFNLIDSMYDNKEEDQIDG